MPFSLKSRNRALEKRLANIEATEKKARREEKRAALKDFSWVEVAEGDVDAGCDQDLDPKRGEGVMHGRTSLEEICNDREEVSSYYVFSTHLRSSGGR